MHKSALLLLALFFSIIAAGQNSIEGIVVDEKGNALPFVNIRINKGPYGGTSDLDGNFSLNSKEAIQQLEFSYIGFEPKSVEAKDINGKALRIVLVEKNTTLNEVTVLPGENPAHRMVRNAVRNKELNDPESLEEFSYYTYSKFFVTMNLDSVDPSIDTVLLSDKLDSLATGQTDSIVDIDSSGFLIHDFFSSKHLFFMETVTNRKVKKPRDNEEVLANRTSGFKNPMFAMLVTQMQSFSFYQDYIGITGSEFLNPISKGSTRRYYFILEDSLITTSGDTIFTLSFRPRPNTGFKALKGVINIDSRDWAIVNLRATPAGEEELPIEIRQEYQRFGPHTWFPISFEADIKLRMVSINGAEPMAIMRRKLTRIDLDPGLDRKDISRNELTIEKKKQDVVDSLLIAFRGEELDSVEQNTYVFIDSLSEAEDFERNLNLLLTIRRGYVPLWWVNLDLGSILNYNEYEGFRLGLGVETKREMIDWLRIGAYYAYGFRDQDHKYGGHLKFEFIKNLRWQFIARYQSDIFETSGFSMPGVERSSLFENSYRRLYIEQWDYRQNIDLRMWIDPLPNVRLNAGVLRERAQVRGGFQDLITPNSSNWIEYTEIGLGLRIAPQEEYAETPVGKIKLKQRYPVFQVQYDRSVPNFWESEFNYSRLFFQAEYRRLSRGFGETSLLLRSAYIFDEAPENRLITPTANFRNISSFYQANFGSLADRNSFETMRFNEFLNSRYFSLMWRQDFRSIFFKRPKFEPHLEMVHRVAFGDMEDNAINNLLGSRDLSNGFFESGLEFNRLYVDNFIGLGIGVFYRYGPNQLPEAIDNWAFKLSSKFSF